MLRKYLLATLLLISSPVNSENLYITGSAGIAEMKADEWKSAGFTGYHDFDTSFFGEIGLGYRIGKMIRVEATYTKVSTKGYRAYTYGFSDYSDNPSLDAITESYFFNIYNDIELNSKTSIYLGGGIGTSENTMDVPVTINGENKSVSTSENAFGYQIKLGTNYKISNKKSLYLEGVYQGSGLYDDTWLDVVKVKTNNINNLGARIGMRYYF